MPLQQKTLSILLRLTPDEKRELAKAADDYPSVLARRGQRRVSYAENHGSISAYLLDLHRKHLAGLQSEA